MGEHDKHGKIEMHCGLQRADLVAVALTSGGRGIAVHESVFQLAIGINRVVVKDPDSDARAVGSESCGPLKIPVDSLLSPVDTQFLDELRLNRVVTNVNPLP